MRSSKVVTEKAERMHAQMVVLYLKKKITHLYIEDADEDGRPKLQNIKYYGEVLQDKGCE